MSITAVAGHEGRLVFGVLGPSKTPVMLLVGRAHFYEGHTMELVTYATRVCKMMDVETMIGKCWWNFHTFKIADEEQ